jgi:septal ring factor EnvC (AmiA/AmiB activator)
MPRGKRKSLEEQIAEIDQKIAQLTDRRKELQEQKEKDNIKKLLDAASKAGVTPEVLVKKLTEK